MNGNYAVKGMATAGIALGVITLGLTAAFLFFGVFAILGAG